MSLINNTKFFIKDEVLDKKYRLLLSADGTATGTYFLSILKDNGSTYEEVASVSYTDMIINAIDPNKIIISSPEIYAELTNDNCANVDYNFITNALR
jgi:hypothetical protein